jgi:hypothetical protein
LINNGIQRPDYKKSILSVSNSLLAYYGATPFHETLPLVDHLLQKNYKNVVFLIFDGLGVNVLRRNLSEEGFLYRNIAARISSVFPPTTTAALTSVLSGKTPMEHGWIGWSCYFSEVDKCVDLFSGNESGIVGGSPASKEHLPNKHLAFEDIFSLTQKTTHGAVRTCAVSPFSDYFANTCEGVCEHIKNLCGEEGRKLIYAYHFQPDHDIHELGVGAAEVREMVASYETQIEALAENLEDTLFLITADHGMTDITMKCIEDFPEIYRCLKRHPCLEARCGSFYVKEESLGSFPRIFKETFGDQFILYSHDQFMQSGLLGEGRPHTKTAEFIGDFVAVAISDTALWYRNNQGGYHDYKGAHAGLTPDEMTVPLIVIEKGLKT